MTEEEYLKKQEKWRWYNSSEVIEYLRKKYKNPKGLKVGKKIKLTSKIQK